MVHVFQFAVACEEAVDDPDEAAHGTDRDNIGPQWRAREKVKGVAASLYKRLRIGCSCRRCGAWCVVRGAQIVIVLVYWRAREEEGVAARLCKRLCFGCTGCCRVTWRAAES